MDHDGADFRAAGGLLRWLIFAGLSAIRQMLLLEVDSDSSRKPFQLATG
jgi:hypothetical protein